MRSNCFTYIQFYYKKYKSIHCKIKLYLDINLKYNDLLYYFVPYIYRRINNIQHFSLYITKFIHIYILKGYRVANKSSIINFSVLKVG